MQERRKKRVTQFPSLQTEKFLRWRETDKKNDKEEDCSIADPATPEIQENLFLLQRNIQTYEILA